MSSRMERCFARARQENRGALVAYLTVGDPNVETTLAVAEALLANGVDALELGAPFSDPSADGPVIARASARAIAAGSSMRKAIEVGAQLRKRSDAPLVLFGYMNPIVVRGEAETVAAAADAGLDGLLVVDTPPDEGEDLRAAAKARGLSVIALLTPTSTASRVAAAGRVASGFIYYVSYTGVTGAKREDPYEEAAAAAARVRKELQLPVVIGFGIDSADKAARALRGAGGQGADGVVVGSALVAAVEAAHGNTAKAVDNALAVLHRIAPGLRG